MLCDCVRGCARGGGELLHGVGSPEGQEGCREGGGGNALVGGGGGARERRCIGKGGGGRT